MMQTPDDEMSIREIARTIADFRQEFRAQIGQLLRADVYRAEQGAIEVRIASLEKDREREEQERAATRRLVYAALASGVVSVIVGIVLAVVR